MEQGFTALHPAKPRLCAPRILTPAASAAITDTTLIAPQKIASILPTRISRCGVQAHLIGIAGTGMQSLAELLLQRGWQLSGSDVNANAALWLAIAA